MNEKEIKERIALSRKLIRWTDEDFDSDQMLKRPQPPLVKEALPGNEILPLPRDFRSLSLETDLVKLFYERRSNRVFTGEAVDLLSLSFLLWACQGVKSIRGKNYATLRTVPSGGARHAFETYLWVRDVEGLAPGLYHYLPMDHTLEVLKTFADGELMEKEVAESVCGQTWVLRSNVILFWSLVPYRGEWRYAFDAHRVMMIDAGHVSENVYLAAAAAGLGTCAIAAVNYPAGDALFSLDGEEESLFYCCPVGTVSPANEADEQAFYSFLNED